MTTTPDAKTDVRPINYKDLTNERHEYLFEMPKFLQKILLSSLNNPADIVMLHLLFNIAVIIFPSALFLLVIDQPPIWLGLAHVVVLLVFFFQRFVLTLHFASHRRLFKTKWFDHVLHYGICPLFGIPGGTYRSHHVIMHHKENNVFPYDVSSTMQYQRDNFFHFLCYWFRYMFAIWFQLPFYAYRRRRYSLFLHTVTCISAYFVTLSFLFRISPLGTTWVFIIPFVVSSFLLMLGNWCQHIFIDPLRYSDSYALTYNLINTHMNKLTFNDGYHVIHHLYSQLHWTELPKYFLENQEKFEKNNSLTFEGMEYLEIGFYVFFGKYRNLAQHYVHLGTPESRKSEEELTKQFKEWLVPIEPREDGKKE